MPVDAITADAIAENANAPKIAEVDGQKAEQHSIGDQIKAAEYARQSAAAEQTNTNGGPRSAWRGLRAARAILPGHT